MLALSTALLHGQTHVTAPANKYTLSDDVKLGQEAAREMRAQLPILNDDEITSYVAGLGRRLVGAIPPELQHPEFRYTFEVGQRPRHQRVRAPRRTDVRQPRDDRDRGTPKEKSPA